MRKYLNILISALILFSYVNSSDVNGGYKKMLNKEECIEYFYEPTKKKKRKPLLTYNNLG